MTPVNVCNIEFKFNDNIKFFFLNSNILWGWIEYPTPHPVASLYGQN